MLCANAYLVHASDKGCAAWGAHPGRGKRIGKAQALGGQAIKVGCDSCGVAKGTDAS